MSVKPRQPSANSPAPSKVRREVKAGELKPKFWRYPSAALDRYGDWLLANLPAMRAEAAGRGD